MLPSPLWVDLLPWWYVLRDIQSPIVDQSTHVPSQLTALPKSIYDLKTLHVLDVRENKIVELHDEGSMWHTLQELRYWVASCWRWVIDPGHPLLLLLPSPYCFIQARINVSEANVVRTSDGRSLRTSSLFDSLSLSLHSLCGLPPDTVVLGDLMADWLRGRGGSMGNNEHYE